MASGERVGAAWYELDGDKSKLDSALAAAEGDVEAAAEQAGIKWKTMLGAAMGATAGAALGLMGQQVVNLGDGLTVLQAQTGRTNAEMAGYEDRLRRMHASNFGEDYQDLARSLATVEQQLGLTGDEADNVTIAALTLRNTFEIEVAESIKATRPLMQNFGIDGVAAMDLITVGMQQSGGAGDDLLDTFQEYSSNFRDMGFSAQEFLAILLDGLENGVRNTDFLADAVKEFDIRIRDGSTSTRDALTALGIDFAEFEQALGSGAMSGAEAMEMINTALRGVGDTTVQEQLGTALYGATWENVGVQAILAMDQTEGRVAELGDMIPGAAQGMADAIYSGPTSAFDAMTRSIVGAITGGLEPFQPALQAIAPLLAGFGPMLPMITSGLGGMVGALAATTAGTWALHVAKTALLGPIGLIIAIVGALFAAWQTNFGGIQQITAAVWGAVTDAIGGFIDFLVGVFGPVIDAFAGAWQTVWGGVGDFFSGLWNGILQFIGGVAGTIIGIIKNIIGIAAQIPGPFQDSARALQGSLAQMEASARSWGTNTVEITRSTGRNAGAALSSGMTSQLNAAAHAGRRLGYSAANGVNSPLTGAYSWGQRLGQNFINGMSSYYSRIRATSIALGQAAATGIRMLSPAEAGPLSEPAENWSRKLLRDWIRPFDEMRFEAAAASMRFASSASAALAGRTTGPALASLPSTAGAMAGGIQI
ncbi:MAG: phage tail tape measure protein, partial [Candidatus Limnocylindria bacterium]